jgi:hypothetical protein
MLTGRRVHFGLCWGTRNIFHYLEISLKNEARCQVKHIYVMFITLGSYTEEVGSAKLSLLGCIIYLTAYRYFSQTTQIPGQYH